jgi:hypothetical protein
VPGGWCGFLLASVAKAPAPAESGSDIRTSAGNPSRLFAVGNGGRFIDGQSGVALISCTVCGGVLQSWQEPRLRVYRLAVAPELKYPHVPAPPSPMPIAAASFQNGYSETV